MLSLNMSPPTDIKFPPLTPSQRVTNDRPAQHQLVKFSEQGQEALPVRPTTRQLRWTESNHIYAAPGRKPQLLVHLENSVQKQLQTINPSCQQDRIRELEPLKSHLRLVTEECDKKIQVRWEEEQAEIGALKREKQQLQGEVEAMREKEKTMQAVIKHLQSELSKQYLQYREECDARKLLIWQLSDQTRSSVKQEHAAYGDEDKDPVELQLALKMCRQDLTKVQEELNRMKAEYWDVVPRRNWDILEQNHKQTLLQLKTLQGQFDQVKSEYDTLLEIHTSLQAVQTAECMSQGQSQMQTNQGKEMISSGCTASGTPTAQDFRTAFSLNSDEEIYEPVAQNEPDSSDNAISPQRLRSPFAEHHVADLSSTPDEPEGNAAALHVTASS
ncbi:translin-associated factor X-interacting protein 1 isoform X2 [Betta splendens]|uniref:Translin-associated factor X-interacting protein 1 isoform X2 n=1 Tax=Betta splendens TaxID=158456 RepID=A0A9W2XWC9_BETSP|nr:translin-associated factor X-interacting protein 1 isoform X2 [Betta splendens]